MSKEATARPWTLEIDAGVHQINSASGDWVCECMPDAAQLIVTAVNEYDTLTEENARLSIRVKELEEALVALNGIDWETELRIVNRARAALEQSK